MADFSIDPGESEALIPALEGIVVVELLLGTGHQFIQEPIP
jgi:hypothetical protein